jgi:glycosyltransferase involved in cell wall biosynthesis
MPLSVIIITRNESANIVACIESVAFADEVIVLDGQSTDDTVSLAQNLGAKVFMADSWEGFGPQKNKALGFASHDWVLSLDADERVSVKLSLEIQQTLSQPSFSLYDIPRLTNFCGQWIHHCGWRPDRVTRLFQRHTARFSDDVVHEKVLSLQGQPRGRLKQSLLHFSYPCVQSYWRKLQVYSQAWAAQKFAQGHTTTMSRAVGSGLVAFIKSYIFRLGFLDGAMGLAVCILQGQAAYGKYFNLYCLNQGKQRLLYFPLLD